MSSASSEVQSLSDGTTVHPIRKILSNQQFVLFAVLVALLVFFGSHNSLFWTSSEFSNLITDFCGLILIAIAETFVITAGGIDLSVGSTIAISGVLGAMAINHYQSSLGLYPGLFFGALVCGAVGALVGIINALLITKARLVPFVATLVTLSAGAGMALVFSKGAPVGLNPNAIEWSANGIGMFTWLSMVIIAITVVMGIVLHMTRYGRYNFAIGSNPFAARAAGINVQRHIASVYIMSGVLAGLAGMFFYIRSGSGAPQAGIGNELDAIAAVVIGGASLTGGVGRMTGTILGAAVLTVVTDGLIFINVQPTWNQVVVAALIAVAALLQSLRNGRKTA